LSLEQLTKEELWFIDHYADTKPEQISPLGRKVALILTQLFGGMHHVSSSQIAKMDWKNDHYMQYNHFGSMATFDGNMLTRLVLLAHEHCCRIEIRPCNFKSIRIAFSWRDGRDGPLYSRHPTIKEILKL
jgi:hypothetical protein